MVNNFWLFETIEGSLSINLLINDNFVISGMELGYKVNCAIIQHWRILQLEYGTVIPRFTGPRFTVSLDITSLFVFPQNRVLQ